MSPSRRRVTLQSVRKRARALSEPYRTRAIGNVTDAVRDLHLWPSARRLILIDLRLAIEAHETDEQQHQEGT